MRFKFLLMAVFFAATICLADTTSTASAPVKIMSQSAKDTAPVLSSSKVADTIIKNSEQKADTSLRVINSGGNVTIIQKDSASATHGRIPVVKRDVKLRRQIGGALGMMAFFLIITLSTQNWNPN